MLDNGQLSFEVTWTDDVSGLERRFLLTYTNSEKSVEMIDLKTRKVFLRKLKIEDIQPEDLFIGNTITILARQLKIVSYGDEDTKGRIQHQQESTFALIKPSSLRESGKIMSEIYQNGLTIARAKQVSLTGSLASALYEQYRSEDDFPERVDSLTAGPSLALVLVGENAVECWRSGLGSADPEQDRKMESSSIRARFGTSEIENVAHCSQTIEDADREMNLFFPTKLSNNPYLRATTSARLSSSTCCVILPHAVKSRMAGQIVDAIQESGFSISALETFHLEFGKAEEFLEVYKNLVENYSEMVKELCSGMCIALEISNGDTETNGTGVTIVEVFREFAGPRDPEIARKLRPNTLRARFGLNVTQNAIHCTDLPEDGSLETEYFFKVLQ